MILLAGAAVIARRLRRTARRLTLPRASLLAMLVDELAHATARARRWVVGHRAKRSAG